MYSLKYYNLSRDQEYHDFKLIHSEFLRVLSNAYAETYFGDDIYLQKINERNLIVLLAKDSITNKVIGCVTMKLSGKLSALAVEQAYRREGLASELIKKLQNEMKYLYAEVATINIQMQELFKKLGFKAVISKDKIIDLLKNEKDDILFITERSDILTYVYSKDKKDIDKMKKFIMFDYLRE